MSPQGIGGIVGLVVWFLLRSQIASALGYEGGGFNLVMILLAGVFAGAGGLLGLLVGSLMGKKD